jgi:hypothetical protein
MLVTHSRVKRQEGRIHCDNSGEQDGQSVAYKTLCRDRPYLSYWFCLSSAVSLSSGNGPRTYLTLMILTRPDLMIRLMIVSLTLMVAAEVCINAYFYVLRLTGFFSVVLHLQAH